MPRRPKGFDPLASLFERHVEEDGGLDEVPPGDSAPPAGPRTPPLIELTDPFFSAPEDGPQAPSGRVDAPPPQPPPDPALLEAPDSCLDTAPPEAAPPEAASPGDVRGARPASQPAAGPASQAPAGPADPVTLARALAKAAASKAGPPKARTPKAVPPPESSAPSGGPRPSRLEALSRRAVRPRSARELVSGSAATMSLPAPVEGPPAEPERAATAKLKDDTLSVEVGARLTENLRKLGRYKVVNSMVVADRSVLTALWRAHRARFAAEGRLVEAAGAAAVLVALNDVPAGRLVVAHVVTRASDYLVWLDRSGELPLAVFADAKAWFGA